MAQSGLNSGMYKGLHQGVKSGLSMSNLSSGLNGGVVSSIWDKSKMQNPANLSGIKRPLIFNNADRISTNTGSIITLTDLVGSGFTLTNTQGSGPVPDLIENGMMNHRDYLDFNDSRSSLYSTPDLNLAGDSEISMILVCKVKAISAQTVLFWSDTITAGSMDVSTIDTNRTLRQIQYGGAAGNINNSQYDSYLSQEEGADWMILTVKGRMKQPRGAGSEQEMHINGRLQHKLNTSTFTVADSSYTSSQFLVVGNNVRSAGSRGTSILFGSFVMFDYWLNESEQLRLENYFRWYYGNSF